MAPEICRSEMRNPIIAFDADRYSGFGRLTDELILKIFSLLEVNEYVCVASACKAFEQLARDDLSVREFVQKKFPFAKWFGEMEWRTHVDVEKFGLNFEGVRRLPLGRMFQALICLQGKIDLNGYMEKLESAPGTETYRFGDRDPGVTILTMPGNLTWNKMLAIAADPLCGRSVVLVRKAFGTFAAADSIARQYGEVIVSEPYQMVIGNKSLNASRSQTFDIQKSLVRKVHCFVAGILEVLTVCMVTRMADQQPDVALKSGMVRCGEKVGWYRVILEGASERIFLGLYGSECCDWVEGKYDENTRGDLGVMPVRRPEGVCMHD